MRVSAYVHMYPPLHMAGAETMLHEIMLYLTSRGHDCRVYIPPLTRKVGSYAHEGVWVAEHPKVLDGADVVLTHLDNTRLAEAWCGRWNVPLVHLIHNGCAPGLIAHADLAVYNSHYLQDASPMACGCPGLVVHPPVTQSRYQVEPGECVTLVNTNPNKGGPLVCELAKAMPETWFLMVRGAYGEQHMCAGDNTYVMEPVPDARRIYERTRILLMPSEYESYGRCAVEASMSGIPIIANPTPGLVEACGDGAYYPESLTVDAWRAAIEAVVLDWPAWSAKSRRIRTLVDSAAELERLEAALCCL